MAITERYVRADADGTGDGTTDANSGANGAFTWTQMIADINTPRVGYRYNVKAGAYTAIATAITGDGTTASPNIIRGFSSTIGDLDAQGRTSGNGPLDTTNFPTLACSGSAYLNANGADNLIVQNLSLTGGVANYMLRFGATCVAEQVKINNTTNNAAAAGIEFTGVGGLAFQCDVDVTAASGTYAINLAQDGKAISCRIMDTPSHAIACGSAACTVAFCVFGKDVDGDDIRLILAAATVLPLLLCNTSYNVGGDFFSCGNYNHTRRLVAIGNHVTDGAAYFADSDYSATAGLAAFFAYNRTRDNTNGVRGFDDSLTATNQGTVTTDAGGAETDYTDATNGDLTLISAAPGKAASFLPFLDIGALQREEPASGGAGTAGVIGS